MWRLFRRTSEPDAWAGWWEAADRAASNPDRDALDHLERALAEAGPDADIESQEEMMDGLRQLAELASTAALPVITSQHRVIGTDTCHFVAPVTLADPAASHGKLFLTSRRVVLVSGGVTSHPWHAVRQVTRSGRHLAIRSDARTVEVQCNSYGDALIADLCASRLSRAGRRS
ncbi:MAG TPA: hypothetical protein VLA20_05915 [Vicinamibacterales bacterium]|nr:hypothetical protein [Vicinamibacterales bacterium]